MASLTEHVIINKLNDDINNAIKIIGGDVSNARGLQDYPDIIISQLISKDLAGLLYFKGVFEGLEEIVDPKNGDIVIVGEKEYVYYNEWLELGDTTVAMSAIQEIQNQLNSITRITEEEIDSLFK